jgi:hypothetical protein
MKSVKTRNNVRLAALGLILGLGWGNLPAQTNLQLTIRPDSVFQTMDNFGTSAAFELNEITEAWNEPNLDTLARLLFSTDTNADGSLRGIGLSGFRVELGACSHGQGSASNISRVTARSKCPLRPDSTYDWTQMDAETWWVRKAHAYNLHTVIGYSNSPPVYYTRNGLACRSQTTPRSCGPARSARWPPGAPRSPARPGRRA